MVRSGNSPAAKRSATSSKSTAVHLAQLGIILVFLFASTAAGLWSRPGAALASRRGTLTRTPLYASSTSTSLAAEVRLLDLLKTVGGRGTSASLETRLEIEKLINALEAEGVNQARDDTVLEGTWRLLYTSTPGNTQSPIQKSLTGNDGVSIFQILNLKSPSFLGGGLPDVSNTVVFGDGQARLRVTALASTVSNKLVQPRVGDGNVFGLYPFGRSINTPPRIPEERIDFSFQEALFEFTEPFPFSLPYPVPFKILGDEAKGFIDNTYYSKSFRISRGNKGTIFLLEKANPLTDVKARTAAALTLSSPQNSGSKMQDAKKKKKKQVAILFPSQLGTKYDYDSFLANLKEAAPELSTYVTPLERIDWPLGLLSTFFSAEFIQGALVPSKTLAFYFKRVDECVSVALSEHPDSEIVILSHSIGGWVARAWLSEWAPSEIKQRVKVLVSLGSPHNPPPSDSNFQKVDQTRGLLTYINANFPGAYEKSVKYVSVIGKSVSGSISLEQGGEQLLAYGSYSVLCGDGNSKGDGIIPIPTAFLEGAKNIEVPAAKHSNFIPTPFKPSIFLKDATWYGSPEVVDQWVQEII